MYIRETFHHWIVRVHSNSNLVALTARWNRVLFETALLLPLVMTTNIYATACRHTGSTALVVECLIMHKVIRHSA